ncbi:carbon catabolite repressor protein 4 homolog 5 isoform X3 [Physcomitrium patens]|uniref:Endonuclease/exonuclease/phosphatase domain-containing protein n=1 Tax=Physcomitrium patens TaxID=3218 RepID=A0A7I4FB57_PHYPA|nr:carbon catabolite repressor protein 4 homolog 6-like isoform X3 [Physcomitrium patens]|eukprot:XP_024386152.1 carbon catabolite repressor protein 4 homolog 6-like isoform X3 [Physcomitrella patens]
MAARDNDGSSKSCFAGSSSGSSNRFRGRGRSESYDEERSVKPRSSRDDYRYWLNARSNPPKDHERFIIVSYNILADVNARAHWDELYWHIPPFIMDWDARKKKLLRELALWSPDIMCLQEVDHYEDLNEELESKGYVGVYTSRTGASTDGCAMFWRKNRFELLEEECIKFNEFNLRDNVAQLCVLWTKSKTSEWRDTDGSEGLDDAKPTIGSRDPKNNCVVVGNTHLLFNPKRGDVKLGQARVLLEKAHAISEKWGNAPVAIAGDFNSTPWSALYRFMSCSQLDLAGHDRRNISGQEEGAKERFKTNAYSREVSKYERFGSACESSQGVEISGEEDLVLGTESSIVSIKTNDSKESTIITRETNLTTEITGQKFSKVTSTRVSIAKRVRGWDQSELMAATGASDLSVVQHKLDLRSAYSEIEGKPGSRDERGEPFVTTFHKKFRGTVDYIWHTDDLVTVRVLDTLPTSVLQHCKGLPSKKWGSDHLALACEFCFAPNRNNCSIQKTKRESGQNSLFRNF